MPTDPLTPAVPDGGGPPAPADGAATRGQRRDVAGMLRPMIGPLALVAIVAYFGVRYPDTFLTRTNLVTNVLEVVAFLIIVAAGQTVVMVVGEFDLSVGGVAALSTAVTASFIATLGMAQVFTSLANRRVDGKPVFGLVDHNFVDIARGDLLGVSNKIWISMAFAVVIWLLLDRTTFGRRMYAVGGNAHAAYLSGINGRRVRLAAFAIAGLSAALGGILQAATTATANTSAPQPWMLQSIAGVFLGMAMFRSGRPNLPGTVLGVVMLRTLDNGLNFTDLNDYVQNAISGAAIVLAVLPPALARLRAAR